MKNKPTNEIEELFNRDFGGLSSSGISSDEIIVYLLHKLNKGTNKLNYLTITLIVLTALLGVIAVFQAIAVLNVQP